MSDSALDRNTSVANLLTGEAIAAYYAEIRAAEDDFYSCRPAEHRFRGHAAWHGVDGLARLRDIDRRHGVAHGTEPMVYSIAAFRAEWDALVDERDRRHGAYLAECRSNPEAEVPPYGRAVRRQSDCKARHFPGVDVYHPDRTIDTLPKLWSSVLESYQIIKNLEFSPVSIDDARRWAHGQMGAIYSALHRLAVPWAPPPADYPRDFTERQYCDELLCIANRLDREEAARLPD